MCGRYASVLPPKLIARMFGTVNAVPNAAPTWNIAPSQSAMVIRRHPKTGDRHLDLLRWGLVPHFTKRPKTARKPINARAETVAGASMFRGTRERSHYANSDTSVIPKYRSIIRLHIRPATQSVVYSGHAEEELVLTTKQPTWLRSTIWVVCLGILATSVAGCVVEPVHSGHHYSHYVAPPVVVAPAPAVAYVP